MPRPYAFRPITSRVPLSGYVSAAFVAGLSIGLALGMLLVTTAADAMLRSVLR